MLIKLFPGFIHQSFVLTLYCSILNFSFLSKILKFVESVFDKSIQFFIIFILTSFYEYNLVALYYSQPLRQSWLIVTLPKNATYQRPLNLSNVQIIAPMHLHSTTSLYQCTLPLLFTTALYHCTVAVHYIPIWVYPIHSVLGSGGKQKLPYFFFK